MGRIVGYLCGYEVAQNEGTTKMNLELSVILKKFS